METLYIPFAYKVNHSSENRKTVTFKIASHTHKKRANFTVSSFLFYEKMN